MLAGELNTKNRRDKVEIYAPQSLGEEYENKDEHDNEDQKSK
jgi:hypothetical protein